MGGEDPHNHEGWEEDDTDEELFEASLLVDDSEHTRKAKSHEAEAEVYIGLAASASTNLHNSQIAVQIAQVHATLALAHYTAKER